jgi:hypothetical protein
MDQDIHAHVQLCRPGSDQLSAVLRLRARRFFSDDRHGVPKEWQPQIAHRLVPDGRRSPFRRWRGGPRSRIGNTQAADSQETRDHQTTCPA